MLRHEARLSRCLDQAPNSDCLGKKLGLLSGFLGRLELDLCLFDQLRVVSENLRLRPLPLRLPQGKLLFLLLLGQFSCHQDRSRALVL